jgi:hypothetical protein
MIERFNNMEMNKRKDERFFVVDDVIVVLRNKSPKIGRVKDISMGGLSFEHIHGEDLERESSERDISLWLNGFSMGDIPCRVVYNISISTPPEYDFLTIHLKTKRCGIRFETLTNNQREQLGFFLKTYTRRSA